jgi:hypothetical protein
MADHQEEVGTVSDMGAPGGHYRSWIGLEVLSPNKTTAGHEAYSIQCAPCAK